MDVEIICLHKPQRAKSLSCSRPSRKKLTCRLTVQPYKLIVYHDHINGRKLYHYRPYSSSGGPITYAAARNPLCSLCKAQIIDLLVDNHGWSQSQAEEWFECFYQKVKDELLNYVKDRRRKNFEQFHEIPCVTVQKIVADEETFRRLVGNRQFFQEQMEETQPVVMESQPVVVKTFPTSESAIKELEKVRKKGEINELMLKGDNTCGICLKDLVLILDNKKRKLNNDSSSSSRIGVDVGSRIKKSIVRLPCKHVFHEGCVAKWLHTNHVCPFCRFELPVDDDMCA